MSKRLLSSSNGEAEVSIVPRFKKMRLDDSVLFNQLKGPSAMDINMHNDCLECTLCTKLENKIDFLEQKIVDLENKYATIYRRLIHTENELDRVTSNMQDELDEHAAQINRVKPQYTRNEMYMDYIN